MSNDAKKQAEAAVKTWNPTHAFAAPMVGALAVVEAIEKLTEEVKLLRQIIQAK